jgi:MarC family membrane protein
VVNHDFISALLLLFLVLDPLGNLPVIGTVMADIPVKRQRWIILRETLIALLGLFIFMLFGQQILQAMRMTERSLEVAGGVILLLISLKMIFPTKEGVFSIPKDREPLIFPLAVPLIAGPSAFATVLLLASRQPEFILTWSMALTCAMALTAAILLLSSSIRRFLGESVVMALERLMGLILAAISIEMILGGLSDYFSR